MKTLKTIALVLLGISASVTVLGQIFTLDPSLKWQVLESAHFQVIFHEGVENLAGETLVLAEEAFAFWTKELQHTPKGKTAIVLADIGDIPAGASASAANKIFISTAWARVFNQWLNSRSRSWLGDVVFHEYGHIVDIGKVSGISQLLRRLSNFVTPNMARPHTFIEGVPIYYESQVLSGHSRATDPRDAMYWRAMVLANRFPSFAQAGTLNYSRSRWPSTYMLSHDLGGWLVRYLAERYGSDKIVKLAETNAQRPLNLLAPFFGDDFSSVLKEALGVSTEVFYEGFQAWLQEQFKPQIEAIKHEGVTESHRLSSFRFWNYNPAWSPDGRFIAYYHADPVEGRPTRLPAIRLMRADGTGDRPLIQDAWPWGFFRPPFWAPTPAWSPDGRKLVYAKVERYRNYYLYGDLYLYDLETKREQRLTYGARAYNPVFFPDGQRILFAKHNWGEKSPDLAVFDLETQTIEILWEFSNDMLIDSFELSSDGKQIALSLWRWGGFQDIYLLPTEGGDLQPLTQDQASDLDPTWSPDGEFILFSSDRDGVNNLYAYRVSDGALFKVTNMLTGAFAPTVSPDSKQIAFVGYSIEGYEIHAMEYHPQAWKRVNYQRESIPEWPGWRKPHFPVKERALELGEALTPRIVLPLILPLDEGWELALQALGFDRHFGQTYVLTAFYNWARAKLGYFLFYINPQLKVPLWPLPLSLGVHWLQRDTVTVQRFELTLPLMKQLHWSSYLSLGYQRSAGLDWEPGPLSRALFQPLSPLLPENISQLLSLVLPAQDGFTMRWNVSGAFNFAELFNQMSLTAVLRLKRPGDPMTLFLEFWDLLRLPAVGDPKLALFLQLGDAPLTLKRSLRGFTLSTPRQIGVVSLEYRFLVQSIEQGLGSWPIFVDDLRGSIFFDIGAAANPTERLAPLKVSLGAELHLSIYLGYRLGPITLRAGVAQGIGEAKPQVYFGLGTAF
jgi:Tol biopolymer transport system component